ncbi:MAG: phosphoribosyltransferase family protein [Candidatus Woesearchaeota archaeon]
MKSGKKEFIDPLTFYRDSFRLAQKIYKDGFYPNFLIGIWRGGTPPGIIIQEFFKYKNLGNMKHIAVRTERYRRIGETNKKVDIFGLGYVIDTVTHEDKMLIVDDVFDEGITIKKLIEEIKHRARKNTPRDIRVATVYYKPSQNKTEIKPHYSIHETDKWVVFPHELEGLTTEELEKKDPEIAKITRD